MCKSKAKQKVFHMVLYMYNIIFFSVSSRLTIGTSTVAGLVVAIVLLNLIMIGSIYLSRRAKRVRIRVIFEQSPE